MRALVMQHRANFVGRALAQHPLRDEQRRARDADDRDGREGLLDRKHRQRRIERSSGRPRRLPIVEHAPQSRATRAGPPDAAKEQRAAGTWPADSMRAKRSRRCCAARTRGRSGSTTANAPTAASTPGNMRSRNNTPARAAGDWFSRSPGHRRRRHDTTSERASRSPQTRRR